jgi:CBS domain-containing membrane protein
MESMVALALAVRDLMTPAGPSLRSDETVEAALALILRHRRRHLTVVDGDGDLVGLVSLRDLVAGPPVPMTIATAPPGPPGPLGPTTAAAPLSEWQVEEVMTSEVETAEPGQSLAEAAQVMFENGFGCLPVVEGSRLVGLLTEADFVRWFARQAG